MATFDLKLLQLCLKLSLNILSLRCMDPVYTGEIHIQVFKSLYQILCTGYELLGRFG